jgi:hypothetical protein
MFQNGKLDDPVFPHLPNCVINNLLSSNHKSTQACHSMSKMKQQDGDPTSSSSKRKEAMQTSPVVIAYGGSLKPLLE